MFVYFNGRLEKTLTSYWLVFVNFCVLVKIGSSNFRSMHTLVNDHFKIIIVEGAGIFRGDKNTECDIPIEMNSSSLFFIWSIDGSTCEVTKNHLQLALSHCDTDHGNDSTDIPCLQPISVLYSLQSDP